MGICCEVHLITKVNECIALAQNNQVTVGLCDPYLRGKCDYCNAKSKYWVGYR